MSTASQAVVVQCGADASPSDADHDHTEEPPDAPHRVTGRLHGVGGRAVQRHRLGAYVAGAAARRRGRHPYFGRRRPMPRHDAPASAAVGRVAPMIKVGLTGVRQLHRRRRHQLRRASRAPSPASSGPTAPARPPHARHGRPDARDRRRGDDRRAALPRHPQPRPSRRRPARRLRPARRPHRPRGADPRRQTMGLPMSRVDEMLDAGLASTSAEAKRRVRNYSLGMRQRLGIAHALLGDPSVLILDEPANGLDPAGIRWMRGLLKGYADRGGTVLLSSHLLNEVEQIADEMILIGRGRIVARGTEGRAARRAPAGPAPSCAPRTTTASRRPDRTRADPTLPGWASGSTLRRSTSAAWRSRERSCSPTCVRSRAVSRTSSSSSPPTPSATTSSTRPPKELSMTATAAPMTLDVGQTARVPFGRLVQGRDAQDGRHPGRPVAADLDRGAHRPGAGDPAVGGARPGPDGRASTTSCRGEHPDEPPAPGPRHHVGDQRVEPADGDGHLHAGAVAQSLPRGEVRRHAASSRWRRS